MFKIGQQGNWGGGIVLDLLVDLCTGCHGFEPGSCITSQALLPESCFKPGLLLYLPMKVLQRIVEIIIGKKKNTALKSVAIF